MIQPQKLNYYVKKLEMIERKKRNAQFREKKTPVKTGDDYFL